MDCGSVWTFRTLNRWMGVDSHVLKVLSSKRLLSPAGHPFIDDTMTCLGCRLSLEHHVVYRCESWEASVCSGPWELQVSCRYIRSVDWSVLVSFCFFSNCPQLSPKKTWEGFIGGYFGTVVFGFLVSPTLHLPGAGFYSNLQLSCNSEGSELFAERCVCVLVSELLNHMPSLVLVWPSAGLAAVPVPVLCVSCGVQQWDQQLRCGVRALGHLRGAGVHAPCCGAEHAQMGEALFNERVFNLLMNVQDHSH